MNSRPTNSNVQSQAVYMFISALLFGYFGFFGDWSHQMTTATATPPNTLIPMVVLLKWTLRVGASCFLLAGGLAAAGQLFGVTINCLAGLVASMIFVVVAIWEWTNPQGYFSGVPAILLVVFAIWNGYSSWMGLNELRGMSAGRDGSSNAGGNPPFGSMSR